MTYESLTLPADFADHWRDSYSEPACREQLGSLRAGMPPDSLCRASSRSIREKHDPSFDDLAET